MLKYFPFTHNLYGGLLVPRTCTQCLLGIQEILCFSICCQKSASSDLNLCLSCTSDDNSGLAVMPICSKQPVTGIFIIDKSR